MKKNNPVRLGSNAFRMSIAVGIMSFFLSPENAFAMENMSARGNGSDKASSHWLKGQLHTHSYWSDGRGFPEQVIQAYKDRGYHFLSITDHNRLASSLDEWRPVSEAEGGWPPRITHAIFEEYLRIFGDDWVDTKRIDDALQVRLKTYGECKKRFETPGEFLLMPGVEITLKVGDRDPHLNYINLQALIPLVTNSGLIKKVPNMTVSEAIALAANQVSDLSTKSQVPTLLMLNHPFWQSFDILPQDVIENPSIRYFETGCPFPESPPYTHEQFWDVVNASRSIKNEDLLYAIASDDAHFYDGDRIRKRESGVDNGFVMVRSQTLSTESILRAIHAGDYYASTGTYLKDISFDAVKRCLNVKVNPEDGVNYTIHFITTKKGFDSSVNWIEQENPPRRIPRYSPDIGVTVKTVSATEASYVMDDDDLYVRARIDSDKSAKRVDFKPHHPTVQKAWTQPYKVLPKD